MTVDFALYGNELGRKFWQAHGYAALARCDWYQANCREAETLWQRAIALREEMGERRFCALNLGEYARCCLTRGRTAEAVELARRGLALSQAVGDRVGSALGRGDQAPARLLFERVANDRATSAVTRSVTALLWHGSSRC